MKRKKIDYHLEELNLNFLDDLDFYLKTEKKQEQITINKTIQRLRTPIKQAISVIEKRLTHHIARKTFASTILLYNDVPMEIVSELLGHSNMTITQESYGKVVQKKVSEAMSNLRVKLK